MPAYLEAGPAEAQPVRDHRPGRRRRARPRRRRAGPQDQARPQARRLRRARRRPRVDRPLLRRRPRLRVAARRSGCPSPGWPPPRRWWARSTTPAEPGKDRSMITPPRCRRPIELRRDRHPPPPCGALLVRLHRRAADRRPPGRPPRGARHQHQGSGDRERGLDRDRPGLRPRRAVGATAARPPGEYFAGYLIEKSLSVDNVFVWAVIFSYFAVPGEVPAPGAVLGHLRRARPAG